MSALALGESTSSASSGAVGSWKSAGDQVVSCCPSGVTRVTEVEPASVTSSSPSLPQTTAAAHVVPSAPGRRPGVPAVQAVTHARAVDRSTGGITERSEQIEDRGEYRAGGGRRRRVSSTGASMARSRSRFPSSSRQRCTVGTSASIFTPKAAKTSADPDLLVIPRFPCLATGTPAAAMTRAAAVLILKVPERSPPVPQVSSSVSCRERMGVICRRSAAAAPAISGTDSPFSCSAVSSGPFPLRGIYPA